MSILVRHRISHIHIHTIRMSLIIEDWQKRKRKRQPISYSFCSKKKEKKIVNILYDWIDVRITGDLLNMFIPRYYTNEYIAHILFRFSFLFEIESTVNETIRDEKILVNWWKMIYDKKRGCKYILSN